MVAITEKSECEVQDFYVQPISQVLEVQMHRFLFCWKAEIIFHNFYELICSKSDVSNDLLFRQEDTDCHQVKMWPPTQQLVIKLIVPKFSL